jgi:hypothetical protein
MNRKRSEGLDKQLWADSGKIDKGRLLTCIERQPAGGFAEYGRRSIGKSPSPTFSSQDIVS